MLKRVLCAGFAALVGASSISFADDTELYLISIGGETTPRPPKVLVIFDNSNTMNLIDENASGSYDPKWKDQFPNGFKYTGYLNDKGIYWNRGGTDNTSASAPIEPKESRRFNEASNGCAQSWAILQQYGRYTGYIREYKKDKWQEVADNEGLNDNKFDCLADINAENTRNASGNATGYPVDSVMYSSTKPTSTSFGSGQPITLYTQDYLVWYQWVTGAVKNDPNPRPPSNVESRLTIAKRALKTALNTLGADVDAGLAVFNLNSQASTDVTGDADDNASSRNGGRIVSGIKPMTSTSRDALYTLVDNINAKSNTPLCETLAEAYRYLSGGNVVFGTADSNTGNGSKVNPAGYVSSPSRDTSIENPVGSKYTTPFKTCPEMAYVIYLTDGDPTVDHYADTFVSNLTANAKNKTADYSVFNYTDARGKPATSYLPALASYMYNNDLVVGNLDSTGNDNQQSARLYTIGFSEDADTAAPLLAEAAKRGGNISGGGYSPAYDEVNLTKVFDDILKTILSVDSSYTAPSIASNNFDKTQTFNSAYYAMFLPSKGPRWAGNLKKLKVTADGTLVKPGKVAPVVDDITGNITSGTCTFWSKCLSGPDGNKVKEGGVLETLRDSLMSRKIYTGNSAKAFDTSDELKNLSISTAAALFNQTTVDSAVTTANINWIYGLDVDNEDGDANGDTSDARIDIMGDPLHSKPLALNFGTSSTPDVRIILGTNQGLLHMFKDSDKGSDDFTSGTVSESWAYIPPELMKNIPALRQNIATGEHSIYGMDSSPVAYTKLSTSTGHVGELETAWIFAGMRRGGSSYYALDVSAPDAPKFMWQIKAEGDFSELGQTWSEPIVTTVPAEGGGSKPVLIFGGGYDETTSKGNSVYIVDAESGALIKQITAVGMASIPNKVAVLDSNSDGVTDRIYATDVSANIWRIDLPSKDDNTWHAIQLASLANGSQRHFFNEPTVAQTTVTNISEVTVNNEVIQTAQNVPYDAVTVGSGNRTHPLDTKTEDYFFVIQDRNIVTMDFSASGVKVPDVITLDKLYDVVTTAVPTDNDGNLAFGEKRGWYYNFTGEGEKSLSASLIFNGKVYFTSFIPPTTTVADFDKGVCGTSGKGRLYVYDLHKGIKTTQAEYYDLGERVPDTPQIVVPKPDEEGDESSAYIIGIGKGECENGVCKGTIKLDTGLNVNKIYYHIDE